MRTLGGTHRFQLGFLCFIDVVVQGNGVEPRFWLIALAASSVFPTWTLSCFSRAAGEELEFGDQ